MQKSEIDNPIVSIRTIVGWNAQFASVVVINLVNWELLRECNGGEMLQEDCHIGIYVI